MIDEKIKISVVVPFLNSEDTLNQCLEALISQNLKPFEILMVDNGSTDRSKEIVKKFIDRGAGCIKYYLEKKRGPACARNKGIHESVGNIIAFTDSDCVPDSNWLKNLIIEFKDKQIAAIAGVVESYKTETLYDKFHAMFTLQGFEKFQTFSKFNLVSGGFPTANLIIRKDILSKLEGFDESINFFGEDYDLCARLYNLGFSIKYTPRAVVYHKHRNSLKLTWKQSYGFGKAHAILLKKNLEKITIIHVPRYQHIVQKSPIRLWVDLSGLDKKLFFLAALATIWWGFIIPLGFYPFLLYLSLKSRLRRTGLKASYAETIRLELLLLVKSIALTCGRVIGGFKNKVICL